MEKYNTFKNKNEYDLFISNVSKYLDFIKDILNKNHLSYDNEEACEISLYIKNNQDKVIKDKKKLISFIAYFGESIIKRYGGEWFFTGAKDAFVPNEASIGNSKGTILRSCPINYIYDILETENINIFNETLDYNIAKNEEIDVLMTKLFPKRKKK